MILLFKRQPTGRWDDTGVGWKRTPTAGSYEALLAPGPSAVLPLPGLLTVLPLKIFLSAVETLCRRETSCIAFCAILDARAAQGGAYRNRVLKALGNGT